jgi:hypothetical protein
MRHKLNLQRLALPLVVGALLIPAALACGDDDDDDAGGDDTATATAATSTSEEDTATATSESDDTATATADGEDTATAGATEPEDADTATAAPPSASGDACEQLEAFSGLQEGFDTATEEALAAFGEAASSGDPEALQDAFDTLISDLVPAMQENAPELLDAYDELADSVPDELEQDVLTLRDFTENFIDELSGVESFEDFLAVAEALGDSQAEELEAAATRLGDFAEAECGIALE